MSHGSRRKQSGRIRTPSSSLTLQTSHLSVDDQDSPLPPPPRKERKHRQQQKESSTERISTTVASGRVQQSAGTGQGDDDDEEETEEDNDIPAAGARLRQKRSRPSSLHASPDVRKRTRARASTSTTLNRSATVEEDTDSGDERDVSDLDLNGGESDDDEADEQAMLNVEARHLIDDFEGNQSSEGESGIDEDVLLQITKIPVNHLDADTWFGFEHRRSNRAEFEDLLALADEPLEGGVISSIWYQDAGVGDDLDNIGDSDSGSGGSASDVDTDEEADQLLLMRSWASDSNDGATMSADDGGDTTDSLDDDDELALIRFGIEVDEDESHDPAPSARASETMVDMAAFAATPDAVINQTASKLGVNRATAARIITGVGLSVIAQHDGEKAAKTGSPAMGEFTATKTPETTIMVDGGPAPVPSPFSARRSARLRHDSHKSPSRRRSSVTSHSSSLSLPSSGHKASPSLSPHLETPAEEPEGLAMDLDDVLHAALLDSKQAEASSESEAVAEGTDQESATGGSAGQFAELSRWDRIPIGAFRRSRANGSRSPVADTHRHYLPVAALFRGSPVLLPVQRIKGKSKAGIGRKKAKKARSTPVKSAGGHKRVPSSLRKVAAQAAYLSSSPRPSRSKTGTPDLGTSTPFIL